jgi:hypothetical protein
MDMAVPDFTCEYVTFGMCEGVVLLLHYILLSACHPPLCVIQILLKGTLSCRA